MTAADNTCEHGWTWGQCCPKPWPPCCEPSCTPIPEQKSCFPAPVNRPESEDPS